MNEQCPLCRTRIPETRYPRHRAIVVDESDTAPNRRHEARLCSGCWDELRADLSNPAE